VSASSLAPGSGCVLNQFKNAGHGSLGVIGLHEIEVTVLVWPAEVGDVTLVDAVSSDDDPTCGGLSKHLGQPDVH
jgi:hypothetical protein